ncbi:hypothetical protein DRN79_00795 [Methanosarcinales archaeon]|nr:MAG: hypothetical protein DRN79_00795 [Methanosarcinales archaeon]
MLYIPGSGERAYVKGRKMKIASNLMVTHNIHLTFIDPPFGRGKQIFDDNQSKIAKAVLLHAKREIQ